MATLTFALVCFAAIAIVAGISFVAQTIAIAEREYQDAQLVYDEHLEPISLQPKSLSDYYQYPLWDWGRIDTSHAWPGDKR